MIELSMLKSSTSGGFQGALPHQSLGENRQGAGVVSRVVKTKDKV